MSQMNSPWRCIENGENISTLFHRHMLGKDYFLFANENDAFTGNEEKAAELRRNTLYMVLQNHLSNLLSGKDFNLRWTLGTSSDEKTRVMIEASENVCYLISLMSTLFEQKALTHSDQRNVKIRSFVWVECSEAITRPGKYATLEDFGIDNAVMRRKFSRLR